MPAHATAWLGLIGAPLLFLTNMQMSFMLVPWVCGNGHHWLIHFAHGTTLLLIALCTLGAWRGIRDASKGQHFIAVLSVAMGAFVGMVLVAHWIPNFLVGACE